ncbi:lysosomal cholesterol signaling protein-like isoform X2 [Corticium candelabrum]|uniref:lysosomal cholesterol signaling protein-like isoform X2 n=1 Tax=Corticium candelabrum TaxID=121492 RepID=UPI002E26093C|nr:lysosomal cholesterol signaling protein-like isoform X2 [Corticium candelabrum]
MDFSDLYSVMLEVFAVVLLGYAIGRLKLITSQEAKGLGRFASLIALPTSLFYNMAKIDFSAVNWMFLLGIFLTKTILFVMVAVGCVVMSKLGIARAGLFAIFATQSNDFAFGLPIINNLYGKPETGFSLGDYVFLIAPISFVILNPIGFAMMEYGQSKRQGISRSALKIAWVVFRGVFTNPIVFMAMLGLIVNPIIDHNVPSLFEPLLKVISRAFDGVALFYLGLSMVGKLKPLPGLKIIIPIALIIIKLLVLPLIANQMVNALVDSDTSSGNSSTDGSDLSTFAFVYGTIPTAPALIFFANQYALEFDLVATSLVLCTFLSAPIIFVSAHMLSLNELKKGDLEDELETSLLYVSALCIAGLLWVSFMFILAKRYRRFLHRLTLIMMATLFIASLAIVTLRSTEGYCPDNSRVVAQFWFQLVGVFGGRFAAAAVSVGLVLVYQFPHERWAKAFSVLAAISIIVPVVLTTMLVGIGSIDTSEHFACSNNSANGSEKLRFSHTGSGRFIYGNGQLILSLLVLLLCVIVCICCLVKVGRLYRKRSRQQQTSIQRDIPSDSTEIELTSVSSPVSLASSINPLTNDNLNTLPSSSLALGATTDASGIERDRSPLVLRKGSQVLKTPSFPAAVDIQSDEDRAERESMAFFEASIDEDDSVPNQQTTRHLLLILYSILSMLVLEALLLQCGDNLRAAARQTRQRDANHLCRV